MTQLHPKVSVVIPAFNAREYIREALQSVWNAAQHAIEIIVIDDGSTDGTRAIVEIAVNDSPCSMRVFCHPGGVNRGISASRNLGIQQATGDYIAFLDADDLYLSNRFIASVAILDANPSLDLVYDRFAPRRYYENTGDSNKDNLLEPQWDTRTVTIRRGSFDVSGLFDEGLKVGEDFELWLRMAASLKIAWTGNKEPVSFYRRHAGNTYTEDIERDPLFWFGLYQRAIRNISHISINNPSLQTLRDLAVGRLFYWVDRQRKSGRNALAIRTLFAASRLSYRLLVNRKFYGNLGRALLSVCFRRV